MSTPDVPNVLLLLQDLSRFPTLADRAQQGFVNFMYLGRWMLKRDWGDADVDQSRLFYDGNSQGGIMGGSLTALAPDFTRAVLGVPSWRERRPADRRADRARLHLGRDVRDLVVGERLVHQDRVGGRARQRVAGHVERVAVRLAAVPEQLDQREEERPLELVRVRVV